MSTLQLACDTTGRLVVEWNKYVPHFRVTTNDTYDSRTRCYHSEEAAMRAAKRLCRKLGLTLKPNRYPATYRLMAQEFPQFDQATLPPIPADWTDSSWHNDACPSFQIAGLQVYIAEVDPAAREMPGGCRFSVLREVEETFVEEALSTDDWAEVLALVADEVAQA